MVYHYSKLGPFFIHAYKQEFLFKSSRSMRKEINIIVDDAKSTLTWTVALFFMLGSSCFVIASAMGLETSYSSFSINLTYFVGSLFFTCAAYGQYLEAINADITNETHLNAEKKEWLWFAFRGKNLGYLSSVTQLAGTLFFNINTFDSFYTSLNALTSDIIIWIPNIAGSILFLIASFFAYLEIYKDKTVKPLKSASWWIVWSNNIGSIFFGVSAVASFVYSGSKTLNETVAFSYTLLGGVGFFIGAFLLLIEIRAQKKCSLTNFSGRD